MVLAVMELAVLYANIVILYTAWPSDI